MIRDVFNWLAQKPSTQFTLVGAVDDAGDDPPERRRRHRQRLREAVVRCLVEREDHEAPREKEKEEEE